MCIYIYIYIYYTHKKLRKEEKLKATEKRKDNPFECRVIRTARSDKKAFASDQCKDIEENSRMGKTTDRIKKTRETIMQRWPQ